jgi:hypothetical protein
VLAGTMLALIVAAPLTAGAGPRVESAVPLPPSLNGQRSIRHREAAPVPPPPTDTRAQEPQPAPRQTDSGFDLKGTLDKLLAASDGQITDKLRGIITSKQLDRSIARAPDRRAVESIYAGRGYAPLWIHDGRLTGRAKAVIARLKGAADEGLDAADYPVPEFGTFTGAEALAEGDIKLTNSALTFARHMAVGCIAPTRVAAEIDYGNHTPEPADILRKVMSAGNVDAALDSFDPPHEGFRALKRKLAELRNASANGNVEEPKQDRIAGGPPIRPGAKDARVPLLRAKLGGRSRKPDDILYDRNLYNAVRSVQRRRRFRDHRRDQRTEATEAQPGRRPRARQHGTLALAAARPSQHLRDGQRARLHAQGGQRPPRGVAHQDRRRQVADADAADQRDHGQRHRQSVLVRAAVDHPERAAAGLSDRPEHLRSHGP